MTSDTSLRDALAAALRKAMPTRLNYNDDGEADYFATAILRELPALSLANSNDAAFRRNLWESCPHQGKYGDDGQMQCQGTDFLTDPPLVLTEHVRVALANSNDGGLRLDAALGALSEDDLYYETEPASPLALEPNEPELYVRYDALRKALTTPSGDRSERLVQSEFGMIPEDLG